MFAITDSQATNPDWLMRYVSKIDWEQVLSNVLGLIWQLFLFTVLFAVIRAVGKKLINRGYATYAEHSHLSATRVATMHTLTINAFSYTVIFFYLYAVLTVLGVPVGTLIAGAGVVGIALGLGAQGFVSDVVTGFFIILEGQFDVGDSVTLGAITGTVTAVGLRTTIVKSADGTVNFIPNRNISVVSNLSRSQMQVIVKLPAKGDSDLDAIRQVIEAVNAKLIPTTPELTSDPDLLGLTPNGDGTFSYQVLMYVKAGAQMPTQRKFLTAYVKALTKAGIALPTTTVVRGK